MEIFADRADMVRALSTPLAPVLAKHIRHTLDAGLGELTQIIVVTTQDSEPDLADTLGLSLLQDIDALPWTASPFSQQHDWLSFDNGWFVAIICAGDTGYASIVLIEEREDELGDFCRRFTLT